LTRDACAIIDGMDELAACLRTWRDRLQPADAGLPAGGTRRAPGLRREEVAHLAGVSVDYLARLEQGRASSPSPSVLAPLARALRLSEDERAHLFRVAGHAEPDAGRMRRHLTPGVQRVLDRLADTPVLVIDAAWEVVASNPLADALVGDISAGAARDRNIAWGQFTDAPSRVVRSAEETAEFEAGVVADLHDALGRHPDDERLRALVDDLRRASERFAELWEQRPVARHAAARKTLLHPEVGTITLDCDVLEVLGSDLRLIVYTAPPGSADARALALLGAVGLQSFA
jgi:transcriptional regulator with XRE-family HTH domain